MVVTETVLDKGDEIVVDPVDALAVGLEHFAVFRFLLHDVVDGLDGQADNVDVRHFVVAADVIDLAFASLADDEVDGLAVVFDIEPVTHIRAVTIDGKLLAAEDVVDDERNEFFRKMVRAVVVGATGDGDGHLVGVVVGHHNHVGTRFRGAVGRVGAEWGLLGEVAFGAERTIDFVGRNLMVADTVAPGGVALFVTSCDPGSAGCVEQVLCAEDVSLEEELWILDGAIHMTLGSEVDHDIEAVLLEEVFNEGFVSDVSAMEEATLVVNVVGNGLEVAGVG